MEMRRRDFVRFLALMAAGAAALPEQIDAFEQYYDLNTSGSAALAAVDEVFISGIANASLPASIDILHAGEQKLIMGINLFGGIVRWVAAPDAKIVVPATQLSWHISATNKDWSDADLPQLFRGHISYIGQDGIRQIRHLDACKGTLA